MTYLVDANVLSEATKPDPSMKVIGWLRKHEKQIVVDPIIIGEIRFGIHLLPTGKRKSRLERWFRQGVGQMTCLVWEAATGLRWAKLLAELRMKGHAIPIKDSMIAATALLHQLTVVTRNERDFRITGVSVINPFA